MYRFSLLVLVLLSLGTRTSAAQVTDDFSDGDFTSDPAWTGTAERWTIAPVDGDPALRSNGIADADTIYLATPSGVSYGTWAFTFRYDGVNLSNANGARVFLLSNTADLSGEVFGYYVQLGANNLDEVRLYRLDGDPDAGRTELGRSEAKWLEGESGTLTVEVERSQAGLWRVRVDGTEVLTAEDNTYTSGPFFGVWVKHSSGAPQAYAFDDFVVTGNSGPVDTAAPQVAEARYLAAEPGFRLRFSEPLDASTVAPGAFTISGGVGNPASAAVGEDATRVTLGLTAPLTSGTYDIAIADVADLAGNAIRDTTVTVEVVVDTEAPTLTRVQALGARGVQVAFSEPVVNGCVPERYAISDVGPPTDVRCPDGEPTATTELVLADNLAQGVTYTLTVRDVEDAAGNRLAEASADFAFGGAPESPAPGELVINEILYDPIANSTDNLPDQPEYLELYNTTDRPLALDGLLLAEPPDEDGAVSTTPLADGAPVLPPGGYAVVFDADRDADDPADALRQAFPSLDFTAPDVVLLPVSSVTPRGLSNSGETIRLLGPGSTEIDRVAYAPEWHTAAVLDLVEVDGRSLERVSPTGPSNSLDNWGTSVAEDGGTPGAHNSITRMPGESPSQGGLAFEPSPFDPAEGPVTIRYTLSAPTEAALARVRIFDARGRLVRTLEEALVTGASGQLSWDGLDDAGQALRVGIYVVLFETVSTTGGIADAFKEAVVLGRPLN